MSLKIGLGASQDDIDVQGEVDFDFFDDNSVVDNTIHPVLSQESKEESVGEVSSSGPEKGIENNLPTDSLVDSEDMGLSLCDTGSPVSENLPDSRDHPILIPDLTQNSVVMSDDDGGMPSVKKTLIEAVIPSFQQGAGESDEHGNENPSSSSKQMLGAKIQNNINLPYNGFDDNGCVKGSHSSSASDAEGAPYLSDDSLNGLTASESFTSVSPLPSPFCHDNSLPKSGVKASPEVDTIRASEQKDTDKNLNVSLKKKEGVKFSDDVNWDSSQESDSVDLNLLLNAIRQLETQHSDKTVADRKWVAPLSKGRKNMTFTNEEVRRIDQENRRLLSKIVAQQNRSRPKCTPSHPTIIPSSAVNRYRQQRQIEIENLALLKRLESAKPSRDVSRIHLLRDFDHLTSLPASSRPHSASKFSSSNLSTGNSAYLSMRSSMNSIHSAGKTRVPTSASLQRAKKARSSSAVVRTYAWKQ